MAQTHSFEPEPGPGPPMDASGLADSSQTCTKGKELQLAHEPVASFDAGLYVTSAIFLYACENVPIDSCYAQSHSLLLIQIATE